MYESRPDGGEGKTRTGTEHRLVRRREPRGKLGGPGHTRKRTHAQTYLIRIKKDARQVDTGRPFFLTARATRPKLSKAVAGRHYVAGSLQLQLPAHEMQRHLQDRVIGVEPLPADRFAFFVVHASLDAWWARFVPSDGR